MVKKYKWKCRVLLIETPNYKNPEYLKSKKIYQKEIKKFHKRAIKLITKIVKKNFTIFLIDLDGKSKLSLKKIDHRKIFRFVDKMKIPKFYLKNKIKPINLSLFSDYNPKTTTQGLGFKDRKKAIYTIKKIKKRSLKYQVNVVATMMGRAQKHPNQTKGMREAILIFKEWMTYYKKAKKLK